MKKNKYLIIILILLVIAAAFFYFTKSNSTINKSYSDFAISDTAGITKIFIADQYNHSVTLTKNKDNSWEVNHKHLARKDGIDNIMSAITKITVRDFVPKAAFDNVVKQLATNSIKVEFYLNHAQKPEKTYYVGGHTKDMLGTYMLLEENGKKSAQPFVMELKGFNGFITPRFFADSSLWRDRSILSYKPDEIKEIKVVHVQNNKESFDLFQNTTGKFILKDSAGNLVPKFDTSRIVNYLIPFRDISYEMIDTAAHKTKRDSILHSKPNYLITVKDNLGKITKIKTFDIPNTKGTISPKGTPYLFNVNQMYAYIFYPDGEKLLTVVQYVIFDNITYDLDYFTGKSNKHPELINPLPKKKLPSNVNQKGKIVPMAKEVDKKY